MLNYSALPVPSFVERDPAKLTAELVELFETKSGRRLLPAQPERLLLNVAAYLATLLRINVQEALLQNLVAFARYPALDHLGLLVGVERLGAAGARARFRFHLVEVAAFDRVLAAGFRIRTKDGKAVFVTEEALVIPRGAWVGEVWGRCLDLGTKANGYQPGDVSVPLDAFPGLDAVLNITDTEDGVDPEDDDHLRVRIMEAPERFSVAGPSGAYRWHAMSAHRDIVDVAVGSPEPGLVEVFPLMRDGLPGSEVLDLVQLALSDERVRPVCDLVRVTTPVRVPFAIRARLTLYRHADPVLVLAAATAAAEAYRQDRRAGLGRDLVSSQLIAALQVPGVYRIQLEDWTDQTLGFKDWADATDVVLTLAGFADG